MEGQPSNIDNLDVLTARAEEFEFENSEQKVLTVRID
jgi:hypothetical protein